MKKILFLLLFFFASNLTYGQFFIKHEETPKFIFGFHSNGQIENNHYNNTYLYLIDTELHISFYPIKNLGFGLMFDYMYTKCNYAYYPSFYSYGFFIRYYSSLKINKTLLDRLRFFVEIDINIANYKIEKKHEYPTVYDKANQIIINIPVGFQFKIWKGLYYETSIEYLIFLNGINLFAPRIGLEYHFNKKKK